MPLALNKIHEIALAVLTNEQKRTLAYERIKEKLKQGESDAKDSLINLAIELAVSYLKRL